MLSAGDSVVGSLLGRPPAIPLKVEQEIAERAQEAAKQGFGIGRLQQMAKTGLKLL